MLGRVDEGFGLAMWALQGGRVAIAAQALGIGQAALDEAIAHAKTREQFGRPIAQFEAIQWMIADAATELDAARMLMWKAASVKSRGEAGPVESSMAKLAASEAAHGAADKAMQVLASAGLPARIRRRTPVPGCAGHGDLPGDVRSAAHDHRQAPERLTHPCALEASC